MRLRKSKVSSIQPMLATLVDAPFDQKGWLFETKWDGCRAIAIKNKKVSLLSRGNKSYNARFSDIAHDLQKLPGSFVVDGEIVMLDSSGRSRFQLLQNYPRQKKGTPSYYLFDIISFNHRSLADLPLINRKKILQKLLSKAPSSHLRYSEHVLEKGKAFFKQALRKKLEGIVAKKMDSPYQFRRSRNWLKIKTILRQEVVIGGFTEPTGSRICLGALLIGVYEKGKLRYVGRVGTGFNRSTLRELQARLQKIRSPKCPFVNAEEKAMWVKPLLVCEVSFAEWTKDGKMRQAAFLGMRDDKKAKDVIREKPSYISREDLEQCSL